MRIVSAPEPVQIVTPSAKLPSAATVKVIVAGGEAGDRDVGARRVCVMPHVVSPTVAASSLIISVWRPVPRSRFSVPLRAFEVTREVGRAVRKAVGGP